MEHYLYSARYFGNIVLHIQEWYVIVIVECYLVRVAVSHIRLPTASFGDCVWLYLPYMNVRPGS
jgi:hypothetical protein